jgi:hypothetical protein
VLSKFVAGSLDFEHAYEVAVESGGDTAHVKTVKKFREWVTRAYVQRQLTESEGKVRSAVVFELRKIETKVRSLLRKLDPKEKFSH